MKILFVLATITVLSCRASPLQNPLVLLDLSPEEAQKYIQQPPFQAPSLSVKTATLPLIRYNDPRFRSADAGPTNGHYWKNGVEIENTDDYVEEVYNARQYHGQDGLGAAAYGYETPQSSKTENIERNGNVKGSYTYHAPGQGLVEVNYYADEQGFHHEDNLPKIVLKPVEETQAVREARMAHQRAWEEAAALAKAYPDPDPRGEYDPSKYEVVDANEPEPSYEKYEHKPRDYKPNEEENNGPPRGFFYSFDYPVSVIVPKSLAGQGYGTGQIVDEDTIAINAQASNARFQSLERPAEVHDAQVPKYLHRP